jgi:RNA polymerase sigma factor (sigma-70 family)
MIKRRRAAKRGGGRRAVEMTEQSMDRLLLHLQSRHNTPSRIVARQEAVVALQVAMSTIDEPYRQAIDLRYVHGWSVARTAETMQRSERAVQMLCYRGLRKLEAAMGRASHFFSTHA